MKKILILIVLISACSFDEKKTHEAFPVVTISDDEWTTYEGLWQSNDATIGLELSLEVGAPGFDSYYKLRESSVADSSASGTSSHGRYSSYHELTNMVFRIVLHDLVEFNNDLIVFNQVKYFRFKKSQNLPDEMFFITRGTDELLPCDDNFKPITEDWQFTLHKRSRLFTVEGYITFEHDTARFFERNTRENWKVANLGELDGLKLMYKQLATQENEGIYLKALAYSILDTNPQREKNALVIKDIKSIGKDPD